MIMIPKWCQTNISINGVTLCELGDVHSLLVSSGIIRIRYFGVGSQFSLYHYVIEMNPEENESH